MPLWIPIVIAAAFLQNLRSLLQKRLTGRLSTGGATFSRFVFAFPLALAYALLVSSLTGWVPGLPSLTFMAFLLSGALTQIGATYLLLASFAHGPFAIGTAYSKTEALQAAVFAAIVLGELLSLWGLVAVLIGIAGVALMAFKRREDGLRALKFRRQGGVVRRRRRGWLCHGLGQLSRCFALVGGLQCVCACRLDIGGGHIGPDTYHGRMAALARARPDHQDAGSMARERLVAVAGVAGSIGWFTALTLQTAALVKALAQVELIFSTLTSWLYFKEPVSARDVAGIMLIGLSIILIVLVA
jgi:drug/metabolite transporter (DMT)-like permease